MARRSSIVVVSPELMPHEIGQSNCSPAADDPAAT
jgi:hypothetical protein